jgi:allophanate hydrolase subunit 2
LGSLSTYLLVNKGGLGGRALIAGDDIEVAGTLPSPMVAGRELASDLRPDYAERVLHAIPGPHLGRLGHEGARTFFSFPFEVSHQADRMGYRLDGPVLETSGDEILSFGLTAGVVQLPIGGRQPILLMADHQTTGGYPVIATVAGAWLPVAAQLAPGDQVRFAEISIEGALQMRRERRAALDSLRD